MHFISSKIRILGTGSYTPQRVVTNEELASRVQTSPAWIFGNLGIRQRKIAAENEYTSDLAYHASLGAIQNAEIDPVEIDLVIVATATADRKAPSTACLLHHRLGLSTRSVAFDISAVCSGFLYAQTIASQFLDSGMYKTALIVGGDTFSKITDWSRRDCVFFGDGAGAVILRREERSSMAFSSELFSDGTGKDAFTVYPDDSYFTMNGKAVYETGIKVLPEAIRGLLEKNELQVKDVSWVIPHQPSIRILQKTAELLGFPFERVLTNMDRYANTSGGTIPIVLDEANRAGKLKKGDLIVFAAVGSGWTWGASLYRW